jgi:excisionase family DNA binding protein
VFKNGQRVKIFSALEVANICGVVNQTAINWIRNGHLKAFTTPGGQYRVYAEDLLSFLEKRGMYNSAETLRLLINHANRGSILVADGDRENNDKLKNHLERAFPHYAVIQAHDAFDAGRRLTESKPGFVFFDTEFPGVDGRVLARRVKEDPAFGRPFVIILTRQQAAETQDTSLSWADALLSKPLDFDQFHRVIKDLEKRIKPADAV